MITIESSIYTHRLLARFVIEATTPLAIGNGEKDIYTDALVATDVNGLPYIPGASIAGVVRSMLDPDKSSVLFGFQERNKGRGSEINFTEAKILDSNGVPVDGIKLKSHIENDKLLSEYLNIPLRQHVRINDKGVAADMGKFDEQVVYAGSRFCFEIEILSDKEGTGSLAKVIEAIQNNAFRIGGGSRKGFGEISIVELKSCILDLTNSHQLDMYTSKSSNLEESTNWQGWEANETDISINNDWIVYNLELSPADFLMFGSGFGDEDGNADMTTVKASKVVWNNNSRGELETQLMLIPATSLKGALRHRTAYHFNRYKGVNAEELSAEQLQDILDNNEAEIALFGSNRNGNFTRGNIIFNDIIGCKAKPKIMQHIAVDRFTGGTLDGALFAEQVDYAEGETYSTTILVKESICKEYIDAFEKSLSDLANGLLPLGGGVNRGHGFFNGKFTKEERNS